MKHPNKLIGRCTAGMFLTCTEKGNFAYHLLKLGKQNIAQAKNNIYLSPARRRELEEEIVGFIGPAWYNVSAVKPIPNPVFLFETRQLAEATVYNTSAGIQLYSHLNNHSDVDYGSKFRQDVKEFLGLTRQLHPLPHMSPGQNIIDAEQQKTRDMMKIRDICSDEYTLIRQELLRLARLNSEWIRKVFVHLPTVSVSNPEHFEYLLLEWMDDPCEKEW